MHTILKQIEAIGIVPVIAIDSAADAAPLAAALVAGGIPCAEVTLRTAAGLEAIAAMHRAQPDMLVGAGTVLTLSQCQNAVEAGAKFIVAPGFHTEIVQWCVAHDTAVLPGCVTPTEINLALELGLDTVKFFPANVYGGLTGMKALSGPFGGVKFVPTGGVNPQNLGEYLAAPFIAAVGGSWLCAKADIAAGNFEKITALCREAKQLALGYELAHIGINAESDAQSLEIVNALGAAFGFPVRVGGSSDFAGVGIEVMHRKYLGTHGHIAIRTNNLTRAIADLESRGFLVDESTAKEKNGKRIAIYLKHEFGGFALHLLQK